MRRHPDFAEFERRGVILDGAMVFAEDAWKNADNGFLLAMDAQPQLSTTPNTGIPSWYTAIVDPEIYNVVFTPLEGANILGEMKRGDWLMETAIFPWSETTGEVSSYGDYSNNGMAGLNVNYPQRQSYLYQTIIQYGEKEEARAGLAKIPWVAEVQTSAIDVLNRYQNLTYHFGVAGLANYGLLNEPALSAPLTPGTKAAGNGNVWVYNNTINATANEVYADIQSGFIQLVSQTQGRVKARDKLVLALSPTSATALTATNSFNVNVADLLKKNFPNIRIEEDPLYGAVSAANPQGNAAGSLFQLIAETVDGKKTGYCAFNEKLRTHRLIPGLSSWMQKMTQGTWGAVIRLPVSFAQMVGI